MGASDLLYALTRDIESFGDADGALARHIGGGDRSIPLHGRARTQWAISLSQDGVDALGAQADRDGNISGRSASEIRSNHLPITSRFVCVGPGHSASIMLAARQC